MLLNLEELFRIKKIFNTLKCHKKKLHFDWPNMYVLLCFDCVGSESFGTVLKQLLIDLTGPEIPACAEQNLLSSLCYSQDLALLGPELQDMDQRYIEEQVGQQSNHQENTLVNLKSMSLIYSLFSVTFISMYFLSV